MVFSFKQFLVDFQPLDEREARDMGGGLTEKVMGIDSKRTK